MHERQSAWQERRAAAMYSSELGGVTKDPALMLVPADDHGLHKGHAVIETLQLRGGCLYLLRQHLNRWVVPFACQRPGVHVRVCDVHCEVGMVVVGRDAETIAKAVQLGRPLVGGLSVGATGTHAHAPGPEHKRGTHVEAASRGLAGTAC